MKKLYFAFLLVSYGVLAQGSLCTDAIVILSLPYSTTDDTSNYEDNYDPQTDTSPACSLTVYGNEYHSGNDVIYSYTPTIDAMIKIEIPAAVAWTGMFMYYNCDDIGISYAACATGPSSGARVINNFAVTGGQTYYIYISSWEAPQTVPYTLNVTEIPLAVDAVTGKKAAAIYPNPATDRIDIDSAIAVKAIAVYNIEGKKITSELNSSKQINVENLESGVYILEITTLNDEKVHHKFIKTLK